MTTSYLPLTREIHALFVDEVWAMGCVQPDVYDDDVRLFARAAYTEPVEVRRRDALQGGVALRVTDDLVNVHPFLFRQVCTNGAIMPVALHSRHVRRVEVGAPPLVITAVLAQVRAALRASGNRAAFVDAVRAMQWATRQPPDLISHLLPMLRGMQRRDAALHVEMVERYMREQDPSAFGLVNAVTSIARDTADPERRWSIEEMGGTMLAFLSSVRTSGSGGAARPEDALVDACA
jgi:hypothetical protein